MYATWHEYVFIPTWLFSRPDTAWLIGQHADGEISAQISRRLGASVVRGSSTRGGTAALLRMLRQPDATPALRHHRGRPRGPRRQVPARGRLPGQPDGAADRLHRAGVRERCWRAKSWDRFAVPLPFSRVRCVSLHPVRVPPGIGTDRAGGVPADGRGRAEPGDGHRRALGRDGRVRPARVRAAGRRRGPAGAPQGLAVCPAGPAGVTGHRFVRCRHHTPPCNDLQPGVQRIRSRVQTRPEVLWPVPRLDLHVPVAPCPSRTLDFLTARRTRAGPGLGSPSLVVVGHRAGQGWLNFRSADRPDGNERAHVHRLRRAVDDGPAAGPGARPGAVLAAPAPGGGPGRLPGGPRSRRGSDRTTPTSWSATTPARPTTRSAARSTRRSTPSSWPRSGSSRTHTSPTGSRSC